MTLRRLRDVDLTPDIIANATRILKEHYGDPLGTEVPFESAGSRFMARLERHYHPPGGSLKPWGPHTGVSTFTILEDDAEASEVTTPAPVGRFVLGITSNERLRGVHPDLVKVVRRAIEITPIDFSIVEGLRTLARQRELVGSGASQTMASRHLTGHAVDVAPFEGGQIHWDWPRFRVLAPAIQQAAADVDVNVEWGANWTGFPDGPHWQLPWKLYP
jgi:peptidoglycan L-alanyl-D-glutamate endopeptidase CwlK